MVNLEKKKKSTWSSQRDGCPTSCAPLWVENGRNKSRIHQTDLSHLPCSWTRGCERHPGAPKSPLNEPHQSAASAHLGSHSGYKWTHTFRLTLGYYTSLTLKFRFIQNCHSKKIIQVTTGICQTNLFSPYNWTVLST